MRLIAAGLAICLAQSISPIASPLEGLKLSDLHDSFNEVHNGHAHEAIDIMAPRGTPVHAAVSGTIRKLFLSKPGGITIYEFDEAAEHCYYYAHLDHYAEGLREGMRVQRGDVIGYVGSTGDADARAPHLHFTIFELGPEREWWKGKPIDPYPRLVEALKRGE
jgi:peptidoglycan LD-endopeptidase LytH